MCVWLKVVEQFCVQESTVHVVGTDTSVCWTDMRVQGSGSAPLYRRGCGDSREEGAAGLRRARGSTMDGWGKSKETMPVCVCCVVLCCVVLCCVVLCCVVLCCVVLCALAQLTSLKLLD